MAFACALAIAACESTGRSTASVPEALDADQAGEAYLRIADEFNRAWTSRATSFAKADANLAIGEFVDAARNAERQLQRFVWPYQATDAIGQLRKDLAALITLATSGAQANEFRDMAHLMIEWDAAMARRALGLPSGPSGGM